MSGGARMPCPDCGRPTAYSGDDETGLYFLRRHLNPATQWTCRRRLVSRSELPR